MHIYTELCWLAGLALHVANLYVSFSHHQAGLNVKSLPSLLAPNLMETGLSVFGLMDKRELSIHDYNCVIYLLTHLTCSLTRHYMYSASQDEV